MRIVSIIVLSVVVMVGFSGCGKTLTELRSNKDALVDNGGSFIKKVIDAGFAVYDIGKKAVEDVKDNAIAVKDAVIPK